MTRPRAASSRSAPAPALRQRRDLVILAGLFALMVVGLAGLAVATGWNEMRVQIDRLAVGQIAALLALSLVNYGFRGLRWHVFARRLGLGTPLSQNLRHFLGGLAMSATPGRVGELVRMRWIRRETGWPFERTAPLVLVDRAADLAAMAVILAVALALSRMGIAGGLPVAVLALAASVVATRPALLSGLATWGHRAFGLWPRLFARLRAAARSLAAFSSPTVMLLAAGLGTVGWLAEGWAFHLLLDWMGADLGLWLAIAIFVFATLAGGLTGAPGGVGGAEAAMVALLGLKGVPLEISVPATAIIRLTTLWFAILIGLAVFPLAERHSIRGRNALEAG